MKFKFHTDVSLLHSTFLNICQYVNNANSYCSLHIHIASKLRLCIFYSSYLIWSVSVLLCFFQSYLNLSKSIIYKIHLFWLSKSIFPRKMKFLFSVYFLLKYIYILIIDTIYRYTFSKFNH